MNFTNFGPAIVRDRPKDHWLLTTLALLAFLTARWNFFYSHTLDVGLHYALTSEFFQSSGSGGFTREHLGVMYDYPAGAHFAAGVLSWITRFPLVSMNVLSHFAIFCTYVSIALFLIEQGVFLSLWRLGVMLAAVSWLAIEQAAFGYQVILNFFFPQLLGEALVFASLCVVSHDRFRKIRWSYQSVVLVATVWILGFVQPLAAVQLATCVALLSVLSGVLEFRESKEWKLTSLLNPLALSMLLMAAVIFHPAFVTMRAVASNDGYLRFGPWLSGQHYSYLVGFGIGSAALALVGVLSGKLERSRGLTLASGTLAAVALLLVQRLFLAYMNLGSDYAVGKHVFFLATISTITFSYASTLLVPVLRHRRKRESEYSGAAALLLPGIFALFASYFVFIHATTWRQDLWPILEYQSSLKAYRPHSQSLDMVGNIASLNKNFTPIVNYLVSVGDLGLPMAIGNLVAESGASLDVPVKYAIVRSDGPEHDASDACGLPTLSGPQWVVVNRVCFAETLSLIPINRILKAGNRGEASKYLTDGWDAGEAWGTWSIAEVARIEISIPRATGSRGFVLRVGYVPFIAGTRQQQSITVVTDGTRSQKFDVANPGRSEFMISLPGEGRHIIDLHFDSPLSPYDSGVSQTDRRRLAIAVVDLELLLP